MNHRVLIAKLVSMNLAFYNLNKQAEAKLGLSLVQYHLLASIRDLPAASPQVIAQQAGIHPSSLTQSLKRLEKKGFIYVGEHPKDSRKKFVSLTAKGNAIIESFESGLKKDKIISLELST